MYYKIFRIRCSRVPHAFLCNRKPRVAEFVRYFSVINSSIIYLIKNGQYLLFGQFIMIKTPLRSSIDDTTFMKLRYLNMELKYEYDI